MEYPNPNASQEEWNQWWQDHQEMLKQIPEIMAHYKATIKEVLQALNQEAHQRNDEQTSTHTAEIWELVTAIGRMVETLDQTNAGHEAMEAELTKQRDEVVGELSQLLLMWKSSDPSQHS